MMKKFVSLVTIAALVICMLVPEAALAEGRSEHAHGAVGEGSSTIDEIAEQFADPENILFDYTSEEAREKALKLADEADYPKQFDLTGNKFLDDDDPTDYVTPVKFQNPWGNCWVFAAIAAAETSILGDDELRGNYVADVRNESDPSKVQMDLSEKQLTYFSMTAIKDKSSPQYDEGNHPLSEDEDPVAEAYNIGGFAPTATEVMASGIGPVLESKDPLFKYQGKKGRIQKEWVEGKYDKYCYSDDDDWAIDENLRFSSSFTIGESFKVPSPATIIEDSLENTYIFNPAGVAAMKGQLIQNRAIEIGYRNDSFNPVLADCGTYINSNWAQYTYEAVGAAHAVAVVGWDDNYPKENFRHKSQDPDYTDDDTVPPGDGAWLVKNSWGSGEEEFPNKGEGMWGIVDKKTGKNTGYFWLSYYDQSIDTPESLDFKPNEEGTSGYTDTIDQHDFAPIRDYVAAHVEDEALMANVFTAGVSEDLKEVGCDTSYPETEVTFDVYLLGNHSDSPKDGLHVSTVTKKFQYAGYHKVELPEPVRVMRGQRYAVVVTQKVPEDGGKTSYAVGLKLSTGKTVINEGESLLYVDGEWVDLSDEKLQEALLDNMEQSSKGATNFDNFAIKGYAEETDDIVLVGDYSGSVSPIPDEDGSQQYANFIAWITDNTGSDKYDGVLPEWKVAEGGEDIVEMKDGRDPSRKTVYCKKYGWTYITVSAEGIGTYVFSIKPGMFSQYIESVTAGKNYLTVKARKPEYDGIGGYEIYYREKGEDRWSEQDLPADQDTLKITGLKAAKTYEVCGRLFVDSPYGRYYSDYTETSECEVGLKNTLKASGKTASVRYSRLKKKSQTIKRAKAIKVSGAKGAVTYEKLSVSKKSASTKIAINKKNGNITVKKGLTKGTYKLKVRVKAAGGGSYASGTRDVTVKIKVK